VPARITRRLACSSAAALLIASAAPAAGRAAPECSRVVLFALPGITWSDVARIEPPALLETARAGGVGSISVRVAGARTSYASGFATLGAGSRLQGDDELGLEILEQAGPRFVEARVSGLQPMRERARRTGYGAVPGALSEALGGVVAVVGDSRLIVVGEEVPFEQWALLSAMDESGTVERAAFGAGYLEVNPKAAEFGARTDARRAASALTDALTEPCGLTIVAEGDLIRADQWSLALPERRAGYVRSSLLATDRLLAVARRNLDHSSDLLLIASPTSPAAAGEAHLGVAVAEGPGYPAGSTLASPSTRRGGMVTLPDVAPTILEHLGLDRRAGMTGRPWFGDTDGERRIASAIESDREAAFVDAVTGIVARGFIALQTLVYLVAAVTALRDRQMEGAPARLLLMGALAVVAFPLATYVMGMLSGHALGSLFFLVLLAAVDAILVTAVTVTIRRPLDRLLALAAATALLLVIDLLTGARLQMNTIFGYSPIVGGRFAGVGNMAFAVLGASALAAAALLVHRLDQARSGLIAAAALLAAVIVVDGAPLWGSDVGGVIALVPAFGVGLLLLAGAHPSLRSAGGLALAVVVVLALFLAFDLTRPEESRTHLARLYESVAEGGPGLLVQTIERKAAANLRLLTSSIWALSVPPAIACLAVILLSPRATWAVLRRRMPALSAGLCAALLLGALGFAVNDSGIGIPSIVLAFFVPYALIARLYSLAT
jgi:hypothetical protein